MERVNLLCVLLHRGNGVLIRGKLKEQVKLLLY